MPETVTLPMTNEYGYYAIRLESIGGLGANLCGKMLGELGVNYLGLNSAAFSGYGSEKTGTPVKGYVRYSDKEKEIRLHSPIRNPHLLAIFHEALSTLPDSLAGCSEMTELVLNMTERRKQELQGSTALQEIWECSEIPVKNVYCIDAQRIAMETKSRINVVMLGAIGRVMGFVKLEFLEALCKDTLGEKYPAALQGNLEGMRRGYNEVRKVGRSAGKSETAKGSKGQASQSAMPAPDDFTLWGYETAPIGGINPRYGSSVVNDVSPSRQGYYPIFIPERCINCGLCDTTCPDMVFQFGKGEYKGREMMVNQGLDYYHCKGCLRCVEVCPVQALVRGVEAEQSDKKYFLPNRELQRTPDYYRKTGPDGYITSESFLTEQRMEGGEV